jgi:hypothetical protein
MASIESETGFRRRGLGIGQAAKTGRCLSGVILASVELTVRSSSNGASDVLVFLTEAEAEEVANALRSRIDGEEGFRGPGYHLHLEEASGSELTIGVLDEPQ